MTAGNLLRSGALPAVMGSLVSLGAQATMALFLLGLFEPQAVGEFSVVAQVAFGWATLALAQSQISLLANHHLPALPAARGAWQAGKRRALWLTPFAAGALWWSAPDWHNSSLALLWTGAIALSQMAWLLSQSLTLRLQHPGSIALVRMVPPMLAAGLVALGAIATGWRESAMLMAAALAGYAAGALWLLPALRCRDSLAAPETGATAAGDLRTDRLKFLHTLSDVVVATLLASHWSGVYGAAQAGCILLLLRITGFIPALVSTAWAQVVLSRPLAQRPSSALAATAGAAAVALTAMLANAALQADWLSSQWTDLQQYLLPVALWQGAASIMAAVSHRPFALGHAHSYTHQCLAMNGLQVLLLLCPPVLGLELGTHLWVLCIVMAVLLLTQAVWAAQLCRRPSQDVT